VCRKAGVSEATYYNWKKKYGGLLLSEMKRLKQLEEENRKRLFGRRRSPPFGAQNTTNRRSATDGRTTSHPTYRISQKIRKRDEEIFGWMKTVVSGRRGTSEPRRWLGTSRSPPQRTAWCERETSE
jgi:hypothetical protein